MSHNIKYSDRYSDEKYEYRHVILPPEIAKLIPNTHLLTETEWRNIGVQQSPGWVHYIFHTPEPHILLFRREKSHPLPSDFGTYLDEADMTSIYALVENIPLKFRTPDLRNFFSYSIENESFLIFNFRKRPHSTHKSFICICKVKPNKFDELVKLYDKKNWIDARGKLITTKCSITKIKISSENINESTEGSLNSNDLTCLLEFQNIPDWMPNGNVGTPTKIFIELINRCIMPQSLIARLGLNLTNYRKHKKKTYSSVEFNYSDKGIDDNTGMGNPGTSTQEAFVNDVVSTASGHRISRQIDDELEIKRINYSAAQKNIKLNIKEKIENESLQNKDGIDNDSGDELEEWDRHEALHDDVTKQDRTSPVFFENEIELKWEKGGSGLVFYTDENFWKDHEDKDFDAETADDLDVDMSVYYESNGGDKDMRDLLQMRREEMLRNGNSHLMYDKESLDTATQINSFHTRTNSKNKLANRGLNKDNRIGEFEKYTKGLGRRLLEKQGWKEGDCVGQPGRSGLRHALDSSEGKIPFDKTGLGYYGASVDKEELIKNQKVNFEQEKRANPYYIASKFDSDPSKPDTLLRRYDPSMKYRK